MLISDSIAEIIEKMLEEAGGSVDVKRNDMASQLGCVPSQISYVITSRFTPERGYITESRRGGGGYIRIVKIKLARDEYLMHFFHAIGPSIDESEAQAYLINLRDNQIITDREAKIAAGALLSSSLDKAPPNIRGAIRADIFRHIIMQLLK